MTAKEYIQHLNMQAHPEGGYFAETFRSELQLDFPGFDGKRSLSTSILFLLEKGQFSALHRIKSDELWYHHDGGTLEIIELDNSGKEVIIKLGKNLKDGDMLQHVVKASTWFGARLTPDAEFCLVGCQVSSGFDFHDFELK